MKKLILLISAVGLLLIFTAASNAFLAAGDEDGNTVTIERSLLKINHDGHLVIATDQGVKIYRVTTLIKNKIRQQKNKCKGKIRLVINEKKNNIVNSFCFTSKTESLK